MGTTRSTVLLCRVTNQTIVCSQTGHERGRERRSHIDPREHQQLITQIYVPIVHCLSSEADSAGLWRGPFDGRRLAGRSGRDQPLDDRRTARRENDGATTRGDKRRTFEDRSDPARIEERYTRSRGTERADHRRTAPPATNTVRLLTLSVSLASSSSVQPGICVCRSHFASPFLSPPYLSHIHEIQLLNTRERGAVPKFRSQLCNATRVTSVTFVSQ